MGAKKLKYKLLGNHIEGGKKSLMGEILSLTEKEASRKCFKNKLQLVADYAKTAQENEELEKAKKTLDKEKAEFEKAKAEFEKKQKELEK